MIYIHCGISEESNVLPKWHAVARVLSLHSQVVDLYRFRVEDEYQAPDLPATHAEALAIGYEYVGQQCVYGAIVEDLDYGIISTLEPLMESCYDSASKIVSVPHQENKEMDEAFVAKFLPDMFNECRRKIALNKKRMDKLSK
jgi:hypothetical protein